MDIDDIYEQYITDLYRYLFTLSKNHHTAEDLVQDTFYRAFLTLPEQPVDNVKAWLFKVAYHTFVDDFRKNKRQFPSDDIEVFKDKEIQQHWTPEEQIVQQEGFETLIELIHQLKPKHQHAVILCDLHELSYEEAAEIMDVNLNSFKSNLYRGRQTLMKKLNDRRDQDE